MNNNTNNNLNKENNQTVQNNVPVTQQTTTIQTTPIVQPTQVTAAVQQTPTAQPVQPTVAFQQTPTAQPVQSTVAIQQSAATQPVQQDIIVQAPPEPTATVTQPEHPKEKNNNKKIIIILIVIITIAGIGLALFINKDKFFNKISDQNEQIENTNNNTNSNIDNNQLLENTKKETFINTAKEYADIAKSLWLAEGYLCNNVISSAVDDGDYYIMIDTRDGANENLPILIKPAIKSPWDNLDLQGYVRINVETIDNNRTSTFYISLTDGTHTISDNNTLTSDKIQKENIMMTTDNTLINNVKMTTDAKDDSGNYTGAPDCTWDATNNKYICTNFTGYGPDAVDKIKAICIDQPL